MTYFFDENISHRHANMLRALREDVVHISKARGFRRSEPDTVWMPKVAAEGWIAVTLDLSIQRIAVEQLVRAKSGLRVVFLAEGFRPAGRGAYAHFMIGAEGVSCSVGLGRASADGVGVHGRALPRR